MIEFDCEVCGKHIRKTWSPAQLQAGRPRYCSIRCKFAIQREQTARKRTERNRLLTADNAIEHYYRARAQGVRHLSLEKVAEKYGYSPGYLRKIKVAYDRAGKWGAKHKKAQQ